MTIETTVRARIDGAVKTEAAHVLDAMGLTVSDAIRMMLTRVAVEKALPFAVKIPNATTIAAMEEGRRGGLESAATVEELLAKLNAAD